MESTKSETIFRLRNCVPFSVFQMIVDKFRILPLWNLRKDPNSKRDKPLLPQAPEVSVMASLYILGRAATELGRLFDLF